MRKGVIVLATLMALTSCGNNTATKSSTAATATKSEASHQGDCSSCETPCAQKAAETALVEVLYMHGKQRCPTCIAIGTEAQGVVEAINSDKVAIRVIDFSTTEGEKIADQYEIASSSIIVVKDGKVDNLTAQGFQYARNNPEQFREILNESIEKMLK